ncbi:MAG: CocE/NonD family hydrolase [Chloroflexi bacterium]|nr:CocE/NonD family hydrolase [Chloroflexota bacterium]
MCRNSGLPPLERTPLTQQTRPKSQPDYDVIKQSDVMVTARDGIRLATDLYLPARNGEPVQGAFPAIMERTPYNKEAAPRPDTAQYFASRGYVVIFQDNRGRFKSEGSFVKYLNDPHDGYDTLEWVGKQPWSNGKVGTFGISYGAHTQAALTATNPPNLACTFMDCGGFTNAHDNSCRNSGTLELRQICWAFTHAKASKEALSDPTIKAALEAEDLREWFKRMPWKKGHSPLRWAPDYEDYIFDMWTRADFDDYWKQMGICGELYFDQYADVPQLHIGSWYDPYTRTTTRNYTGLSPIKKGPVRMILGPWTHGAHDVSYSGDVDFGPDAVVAGNLADDYNDMRLRWFDRWLKGMENAVEQEASVRIFVMGGGDGRKNAEGRMNHGGRWRDEQGWPIARARNTEFYFHSDGSLSTTTPQQDASPSRYTFDPKEPVPTIGGNISSGADIMVGGAFHQQEGPRFFGSKEPYLPLASRHDVLVFETPPLDEEIEVTGPVIVRLWASSSCVDTDFTAKLIDVHPPNEDYPQGFDMNITDGVIRARYRDSSEKAELMEPGKVYEFTIELYPTSNLFARGHRIRVDISSSNFPRLDVNPNTGEPLGLSRRTEVAENTVQHDRQHPSHILLPVIPTG